MPCRLIKLPEEEGGPAENRGRGSARGFLIPCRPSREWSSQRSLIRHLVIDWPGVLLISSTNACSRVKVGPVMGPSALVGVKGRSWKCTHPQVGALLS